MTENVHRCCDSRHIELINAAVWERAGDGLRFFADHYDAGRLHSALEGAAAISVRSVRLRDYLDQPVDLLKMDIEGAEVIMLRDCSAALRSVRRICVEYHSFADAPQEFDELLSILRVAGFRIQIHSGKVSLQPFLQIDTFLGMDMQLDIFGIR